MMKQKVDRIKKKEIEKNIKEDDDDEEQLDLEEQQMRLDALSKLLSSSKLGQESESLQYFESNSSLPIDKQTQAVSLSNEEERQLQLKQDELEDKTVLEQNEQDAMQDEPVVKQTRRSLKINQQQRKVSFQAARIENAKLNNQFTPDIRVSVNELISDEDLQQVERLSSKQIASNQQFSKQHLDDDPMNIQGSSEKLKQLLIQPSQLRSESVCKQIANEMKKVKFLQKYKDMPEFLDICKNLYIKQYDKKQFVFKQGEYGDAFYIILYGSVTIYIDEPTEYKSFMQLKEVAKLEQGDAFGEIALIYDSQRTATIISNEKTLLIVLEKSIFQAYIKELKNQHLSKQVEFLESMDFFKHLKQSMIIELTTKLQTREYTSNEIIAHEGELLASIIFIKSGRAKIYRSINFRVNRYSGLKLKGDIKDPTPDEIERKAYATELIEIDELSDYSTVGDYSLLYNKPLDYTMITTIPTEVYYISSYDIIKIIPLEFLEKHRKNLKKYPNNTEIRQIYWEKREWESFSKKVISNIMIEKENRKGFEKSLKKPTLKYANINTPINIVDIQSSDNTVYLDFLSDRVPRGLQTKRNVNGLFTIQQSISQPTSTTALNLWEKLREVDGIDPPQSPSKQSTPREPQKYQQNRSSLPNLKVNNVQQKSQFVKNQTPSTSRYSPHQNY